MDATAILEISNLAVRATEKQRLTDTDIPGFLVGDKLITTEHLQAGRTRYRGKFETSVLADFGAYVEGVDVAPEHTQGFIQPDDRTAVAFLNLGTPDDPGHGDWRANLSLVKTAGYAALCALPQATFTQRSLAEWCEDWAQFLRPSDADQTLVQAIAAIRNVTVTAKQASTTRDEQYSASRSSLEEVEAKSNASKLPQILVFSVEPHVGFDVRDFALRVNLGGGPNDAPRFTLRVVSKEAVEESIAQEFKAKLATILPDVPFTIGKFTP